MSVASFPPGHIFFSPDERGDRLYLLQSGRVRLYKLSAEGRALTLALLEPPAVFGELSAAGRWPHDSFAEAMTACAVGIIGQAELQQAMAGYPEIALGLMQVMGQRLRVMENKLSDIAFKSVPQRLATMLLGLAGNPTTTSNGPTKVVRYTHQQLAEMIGSYRETVTKAIGELRESGVIRIEDDTIFLIDLPRLQALAGK
jgi:CRP-like cAMP-binding protein